MPAGHHRTPERGVTLAAVGVALAASAAVLVPVLMVRGEDRPLITAPPVGTATTVTGTPETGTPGSPLPAPGPAGSVLSTVPATPTAPVTSSAAATVAPTPSRPPTTRPPTTRPPAPEPTPASGLLVTAWVSGLCLGTGSAAPKEGAAVVQQPCGSPQVLRFELRAGTLTDRRSGLCLDVDGASADDGAEVQLWTCTGGGNQLFAPRAVPDSGGRSQLVAGHSGKCVDVSQADRAAGAAVLQYGCHAPGDELTLRNQSWLLGA